MSDLKIVGWTSFDSDYPSPNLSQEEFHELIQIIHDELFEKGYLFTGQEHQYSATGVPVFSDGTCFRASMRCWGTIMSTVYTGPDGEELSYMDFYTSTDYETLMPEYKEIDVECAVVEKTTIGCMVDADKRVLSESLSLGMPFMTLDKVLKAYIEKVQGE